jgi:hypothetical protein
MDDELATEPKVGDGATEGLGSDRYPYTIIEVISPRKIVVQEDHAEFKGKTLLSELQHWVFTRNPEGRKVTLTLRKDGRWRRVGKSSQRSSSFSIGHRSRYRDPHV